jgi:hypothetical protein
MIPNPSSALDQLLRHLGAAEAKTLLLELAQEPLVRELLLGPRFLGVLLLAGSIDDVDDEIDDEADDELDEDADYSSEALESLMNILEDGDDIEYQGDLATEAFVELEEMSAAERSQNAMVLRKAIEAYEPNEEYDHNDEGGEMYWEDRRLDWIGEATQHWASAECELGRGEAAFARLIQELPHNHELWMASFETAVYLHHAGHDQASKRLSEWIKKQEKYSKDQYQRQFLAALAPVAEYERYLRTHCEQASDYLELFGFLNSNARQAEALEVAVTAVRQLSLVQNKEAFGSHNVELIVLIEALRQNQPAFEWEVAAFAYKPSLSQYQALKQRPEFAAARAKILALRLDRVVHADVLLEDDDRPALQSLLARYPVPEFAVKFVRLFPAECAVIFRRAVMENIVKGDRKYYQIGAHWAGHYKVAEQPEVFNNWLVALLAENSRRPALLDEFSVVKPK